MEKRDEKYRPALDKAIRFVLDSQYPVGGWPQRYPRPAPSASHGGADYTSYVTFNDDVAAENIEFLTMCYQAVGDERLRDPIARGMNAFVVMQQPKPQAGWALQYTLDLKPSGARTYEPNALVTHTTATNIERLISFYRMTGDSKFLARIPEALDWLERVQLPAGIAPAGRTHPTFVEIGTDKPLYVHRRGSNVVNGRYYVDYDHTSTIGHYSAFRRVDLTRLRKLYEDARALSPRDAAKGSPLAAGAVASLPGFFTVDSAGGDASALIASLNAQGYWAAPLGYNSHPYKRQGSKEPVHGNFAQTYAGDETDTSPFPDPALIGISTSAYIRNMGVLIRALPER